MTQNQPPEPERRPSYHRRDEKEEEKRHEKEEKTRNEKNWDEKWRRDPINAISWAAAFIWAGICLLAETTGWADNLRWWETWAVILTGVGIIFVLGALARLVMPEHRRPIIGNLIFGFIITGVGLGELTDWGWGTIGSVGLIAIGLVIILGGIFRRRR